jgi:hypothetical protein
MLVLPRGTCRGSRRRSLNGTRRLARTVAHTADCGTRGLAREQPGAHASVNRRGDVLWYASRLNPTVEDRNCVKAGMCHVPPANNDVKDERNENILFLRTKPA